MTVIPFRVMLRAKSAPVNDGWSDRMVPAGETFACSPRRAAELVPTHADLVTFDADDVGAIASFSPDPDGNMLKLALGLGIRPDWWLHHFVGLVKLSTQNFRV